MQYGQTSSWPTTGAGAFTVGHVAAPRATRLLTAMYSAYAVADAAQLAYAAAEHRT